MENIKLDQLGYWNEDESVEHLQVYLNCRDCILDLSDGNVAKFLLAQSNNNGLFGGFFGKKIIGEKDGIENLFKEYETLKFFYEGGISFPNPKGIFYVKRPILKNESSFLNDCYFSPALVMKKAEGQRGDKLPLLFRKIAYQEIEKEKQKLEQLGFFPKDGYNNLDKFFYDSGSHKLTLTGVNNWERK